MIRVIVSGAFGRMGQSVCNMVENTEDFELVGGVDPIAKERDIVGKSAPAYSNLEDALSSSQSVDVVVDFTRPDVAKKNISCILKHNVNCVLGTTGLNAQALQEIYDASNTEAALFFAPNFTTGAVLMMEFSKLAAKYFPDVDIIELHHNGKKDAPSGTAVSTANIISSSRDSISKAPGKETELLGYEGARGANVDGVYVHSVRSGGHMAHQEVIFGDVGQTLTIRHDSIDRACYMPGVEMAIRKVINQKGLVIGLEKIMGL